jgi:hypothetical protein
MPMSHFIDAYANAYAVHPNGAFCRLLALV